MKFFLTFSMIFTLTACSFSEYHSNDESNRETPAITENKTQAIKEQRTESKIQKSLYQQSNNAYIIDKPYTRKDFSDDVLMPEIYTIVATRAINKMLQHTNDLNIDPKANNLYIETFGKDEKLPNGHDLAEYTGKKILESSKIFTITDTKKNADYIMNTEINKVEIQNLENNLIQYKTLLFDKDAKKIDEWSETIRQTQNFEKSWW